MLRPASALVCMLITAIALWGWGRLASHLAKGPKLTAPVDMALGMAVIVCVGGFLNVLRIAHGLVLDGVLVIGAGAAVREGMRALRVSVLLRKAGPSAPFSLSCWSSRST